MISGIFNSNLSREIPRDHCTQFPERTALDHQRCSAHGRQHIHANHNNFIADFFYTLVFTFEIPRRKSQLQFKPQKSFKHSKWMSAQPRNNTQEIIHLDETISDTTQPQSATPTVTRPQPKFSRGRNFVFTLNNPTTEENFFWQSLLRISDFRNEHNVRYVIFQTERSATGTVHLQGYVELNRKYTLTRLRREFGSRTHFERRRGTQAQAIAYAKKEDTRVNGGLAGDGGEAKKLGSDTLSVVAAALKLGSAIKELSEDYPVSFIMHGAKIRSYALNQMGRRMSPPEVIIYYGTTGTGKSATAAKNWPEAYWVPQPRPGGWWWPNYCGEKTVIIDEFANQFKYHTMLRLLDRYPFDLQEKGSNMQLASNTTRIVFTTNIHPHQWYHNIPYRDKAPLRRRFRDFAKIYTFANDSTWDDPIMSDDVSTVDFSIL